MPKIIVMYSNEPPSERHIKNLGALAKGMDIFVANSEKEAIEKCPAVEIALGHRYCYQILPHAKKLKWLQSTAAGPHHLLTHDFIKAKPILTRCPIFSDVIAFHAFTLALSLIRCIPEAVHCQIEKIWAKPFNMMAQPKKAMIIGMGCIGKELGKLLKQNKIKVFGVDKGDEKGDQSCDHFLDWEKWRDYLKDVDLCFLAIPDTQDNHHFFDSAAIGALPKHAVLVNVGRGSTLDVDALAIHLQKGHLGGAALDVLESIPSKDDPIWSTPRLLITPKVSTFIPDRQERLEKFIEEQVQRYLSGEKLLYRMNYL